MPSTPRAFAPPSHQNVAAPFAGPNGYGNAGDEESAPLTYQVYAPDSVPPPRPMNISRMSMPDFAPKPNIKARIILGIAAACVFIGTAILIIVGASDDPPRAKAAAGVATATNAATSAVAATPLVAPLIIAPPVVDPPPAASAAVADPPPAPVAKAKASKAKASSSAGARGAALPPNPFAAGSPVKPAKKK